MEMEDGGHGHSETKTCLICYLGNAILGTYFQTIQRVVSNPEFILVILKSCESWFRHLVHSKPVISNDSSHSTFGVRCSIFLFGPGFAGLCTS